MTTMEYVERLREAIRKNQSFGQVQVAALHDSIELLISQVRKDAIELEHRRSVMSRQPFCSDHRDKVADLSCRQCALEQAEKGLRRIADMRYDSEFMLARSIARSTLEKMK